MVLFGRVLVALEGFNYPPIWVKVGSAGVLLPIIETCYYSVVCVVRTHYYDDSNGS